MEKGRYGINLYQELVTHVTDDQQLFRLLRQIYRENKGDLKLRLSLRTVSRIQLVKVSILHAQLQKKKHSNRLRYSWLTEALNTSMYGATKIFANMESYATVFRRPAVSGRKERSMNVIRFPLRSLHPLDHG